MKKQNLTKNEKRLIEKYLYFYESLDKGIRTPNTKAQEHFIQVCRKEKVAKTEHEIAYSKYIGTYKRNDKKSINRKKIDLKQLAELENALNENQIKVRNCVKRNSSKVGLSSPKKKKSPDRYSHSPNKSPKIIRNDFDEPKNIDPLPPTEIEKEAILNKAMERQKNMDFEISLLMKKKRDHVPEYEEGTPRPGWFTDDDWKKMRKQDYAAMKKIHKE